MNSVVLRSRSGPDSNLHLEIPVGRPDTEFEVEITFKPQPNTGNGWPPNYFDLFGAIHDPTFVRPPQGELPPPVELE